MARLNRKILCFVDEYGTAGNPGFALGCVMIWARECGKAHKAFSDLLPKTVNEVHATNWQDSQLQSILGRYAQSSALTSLLMLNKHGNPLPGTRPQQYARALIETVKIGAKRFATAQGLGRTFGNIEVITDLNEQNTHASFDEIVSNARKHDGLFRAVNRVTPLDSAASRMLQLTDIVAYSRRWVNNSVLNSRRLRKAYKIEIL